MNTNALWESLQNSLGAHLPQLFGALAILLLGWVVALLVRAGARRSLGFMGVNHRFGRLTGKGVDIEGFCRNSGVRRSEGRGHARVKRPGNRTAVPPTRLWLWDDQVALS